MSFCDFDMWFTYVATWQPGAMHDTSVLYNAISVDEQFFFWSFTIVVHDSK
jgi:hypothetical protein